MIALVPSLCSETVRNVTLTEIREWNVTDVVTNVSSDCCLNCSYSHMNVSEFDKMTIMEDIHGLVKCPSECSSYTAYIHVRQSSTTHRSSFWNVITSGAVCTGSGHKEVSGRPRGEAAISFKYEAQRRSFSGNNSCKLTVQSPVVALCTTNININKH